MGTMRPTRRTTAGPDARTRMQTAAKPDQAPVRGKPRRPGAKPLIAVIDTTFSRFDMGSAALEELAAFKVRTVRHTVPGIKDLAVECKRQLDGGADIALALGMVGGADIDRQCAHEASLGIQMAKIATNKHIIEVFVHENEAKDNQDLAALFEDRTRKHARNAARMLLDPDWLTQHAGAGLRQGRADVGGLPA